MKWNEKTAKIIRAATTAPFFAFFLCLFAGLLSEGAFASAAHYGMATFFLTVLPLLAYPVAYLVPALHKRGRNTERNLAIVFSVAGYIGGFLYVMLCGGTGFEKVVFGTYLISGVIVAVCTCVHFKASGHTCGCSGPIAILAKFVSPWFLLGYLFLIPICWSSRKLKRHSAGQLAAGTVVPVLALWISCILFLG